MTHILPLELGDATPADRKETATNPPYVLVVDDEPVVRHFLTMCLGKWGYATKEAGSAEEALDLMIARPASIVLCDVKMPGHDGLAGRAFAGRLARHAGHHGFRHRRHRDD